MHAIRAARLRWGILALAIGAAACGGEGGDIGDFCARPQIMSTPPTQANVGHLYVYQVDAAYDCGAIVAPLTCRAIGGTRLPPGAYAGFSGDYEVGYVVTWMPDAAYADSHVQFQIATQPDRCDRQATQSWTVNVAPYTAPVDNEPPQVSKVAPANSATNVPTSARIVATFSEQLDTRTIDAASYVLIGPEGPVPGRISVSGRDASFQPEGDLSFQTEYRVQLTTAVRDLAGNELANDYAWTFQTGTGPDTQPPTSPVLDATYVGGSIVGLSWDLAVDDVAVQGYDVRRDGTLFHSVRSAAFGSPMSVMDKRLDFGTGYCYTISAVDSSDNASPESAPLCVTTLDFLPGRIAGWGNGGGVSGSPGVPDVLANVDEVVAISQSPDSGLAVRSDGTVWQWQFSSETPVQVAGIADAVAVAGGDRHFLAVGSDGKVWSWAQNAPVQLQNVGPAASAAAGSAHSLVLSADGTVWAVGGNESGQLGDGTTVDRNLPIQVPGLSSMVAVAACDDHSLALRSDGTVWAWGHAFSGSDYLPHPVAGVSNAVAIAQGYRFALAVNADGTVWAWGVNSLGQLGDGTTVTRTEPGQVLGITGITAVAAGRNHALALRADGTVWAWGSGSLGTGTAGTSNLPVQVERISGAKAIAANYLASMALR